MSQPLPIGTILDGKFRITKEIGRGGMAAVFEAENVDIGKRVAVKVLAAELVSSRVVTERFIREARASAAVRSPYICDVYDVGTYEDRPFLVMELLEGESLYDRLSRVRRMDIDHTLTIAQQTCRGLSKAHAANVVHRDLKPENIFLTKNEDGEIVAKIVDFGLAKFYEPANEGGAAARLTKEGALFGTPAYMSPEQAKAQGEVDLRSDLWALACIVYECLTGRTVWNVDQGVAMILAQIAGAPIPRPSRLRSDLPQSFDEWFLQALNRDANKRFQTAQEFANALRLALRPSGSIKQAPLHTEQEGEDIDKLVSVDVPPAPLSPPGPPPPSLRSRLRARSGDAAVPLPSSLPPPHRRGPAFALGMLFATSVVVLGGYAAWLYLIHPPVAAVSASGFGDLDGSATRPIPTEAAETAPFALEISKAQERLARGDATGAVEVFKAAFESSKKPAVRSFLNQAEVLAENTEGGRCRVTAIGRPRAFDGNDDAASLPAIFPTSAGLVVAWAAMAPQSKKRQVFGTLLDGALRRVLPILALSPESSLAQEPILFSNDKGPVLTFWDNQMQEPGVYLRQLDVGGRILGPARRVAATDRRQSYPAIAPTEENDYWVIWTERIDSRVSDLMARKVDADLKPTGDVVRLTAYSQPKVGSSVASKAVANVAHGFLNVAFALDRHSERHVLVLRTNLSDPALKTGGVAPAAETKEATPDRFLGQVVPISTTPGKHNQPDIACNDSGCFTVWDDEKAGAFAAFTSAQTGEVIWRREIASRALRPSIESSPSEVVVAWYEGSRLRMARITRDQLDPPSIMARAAGYQPSPGLAPGEKPGRWYVSWRDFEAAQHEAFVLRADCK